jgi:Domain of unknown function (DUF4188)
MSKVVPGRFSAQIDESFVVFAIGMQVNNLWAIDKWLPTARAMGPMLNVLHQYPEKGFLGQESFFRLFPICTMMMTYWKSFEHLEHFARNTDDPHLEPWREFNRSIGNDGSVGIWHETYLVPAKQSESIYVNMPIFGLAAATNHVPIVGRKETARRRLVGEERSEVST